MFRQSQKHFGVHAVMVMMVLALIATSCFQSAPTVHAAAKSNDTSLKSIKLFNGEGKEWPVYSDWGKLSPKFSGGVTDYKLNLNFHNPVPNAMYSWPIKIRVTLNAGQKLYFKSSAKGKWKQKKGNSYTVKLALKKGKSKTLYFKVKASSGKSKVYKIKVHQYVVDAKLDKIIFKAIDEAVTPDMDKAHKAFVLRRYVSINYEYLDKHYRKGGTCNTVSWAYQQFMHAVGITCRIRKGFWRRSHAWVIVKIGGYWYHIEPQISGGISFLRSDKHMSASYKWSNNKKSKLYDPVYPAKEKCPRDYPDRADFDVDDQNTDEG